MKRWYAIEANRVFLLSVILPEVVLGLAVAAGLCDRMALRVLVQASLLFPAAVYLFTHRGTGNKMSGLRLPGWKEWLLLLPLAVCVEKIITFLGVVSGWFVKDTVSESMATLVEEYPLPLVFFVIAVLPAICEETVYRGVLYRGYRNYGAGTAVVMTAVLFGLMHMNPDQFFYAVVFGLLLAAVNEITDSIVPSVLVHLYVNGRSVLLLYEAMKQNEGGGKSLLNSETGPLPEQIGRLFLGFLIAIAGTVLVLLLLLRCRGRKVTFKKLFRGECVQDTPGEKAGIRALVSPTLGIGILYCILSMVWR